VRWTGRLRLLRFLWRRLETISLLYIIMIVSSVRTVRMLNATAAQAVRAAPL
jgi:hypothetical protein